MKLALADATVGDALSGYQCMGASAGGTIAAQLSIYAGMTVPTSIQSLPTSGAWPGETEVVSMSVNVMLSVATSAGSSMYNTMINQFDLGSTMTVDAPNTYLRVVIDIPSGSKSQFCTDFGFGGPGAFPLRDNDGRIGDHRDMVYSVGDGFGGPSGWFWNESNTLTDPTGTSTGMGVNGDWLLRLDVEPSVSGSDAGVSGGDAGTSGSDAGSPGGDGGAPPTDAGSSMDAGSSNDDAGASPMCATSGDCAGGKVCRAGMCVRVSCTTASDCAGGMTCVDMHCRALCSSNADCAGGEVCDMTAGYCQPVGSTSSPSGGCGCRAAGAPGRSHGPAALALLAVLGLAVTRRRRR